MKTSVIVAVILLVVLLGAGVYYFRDLSGPSLTLAPDRGPISARRDITLNLADPGSGLRSLSIEALQGEKKIPVLAKQYPAGSHQARETFRLPAGLKEGTFQLQISATDRSPMHFGAGNLTRQFPSFDLQNKPPSVAVLSVAHNIARGGAALVVYTVNREVERSGVVFADRFFPGYRQSGDLYACLFAFPFNLPAESFVPKVLAVDRASNERLAGIYFHLLPKAFPHDRIELSDSFLEKVAGEFKDRFPQAATPLDVFLKANWELREHDLKILAECGRNTSKVPVWEGVFLRLPNSAPRGTFAQLRSYYFHGKEVDQQTHLGIDLAALAHTQVPAANTGKVVYADDLGIYGQCVIIDHGLGLQTLYGHLSRIAVKAGDQVKKGQIIGNTGDTGLAGGDHLHFGVVVSGEQVNPIEWWDPSWIKNNVTGKLAEAASRAATP
ncbi:peptidase M24 [Geomonas silvestris]|uniref:Peptidase M24 n=1 Tax=Geomonas silvestris TaxID=2740184 RepID=A0A6V8MHM1_9BACT|nr:M23 family metallopeptidase [Geomonas silvestris]GFO59273.1 peptidase M24 [Geomonas silvestris]